MTEEIANTIDWSDKDFLFNKDMLTKENCVLIMLHRMKSAQSFNSLTTDFNMSLQQMHRVLVFTREAFLEAYSDLMQMPNSEKIKILIQILIKKQVDFPDHPYKTIERS